MRNFKRFGSVDIELGNPVVFIGPNNSGKSTALQALGLWYTGLKRWTEKRGESSSRTYKRPGVTINRRDLLMLPVPMSNLLWKGRHTRSVSRQSGKQKTENIRIDIILEGVEFRGQWTCGLEFDYANEESIYCRPIVDPNDPTRRLPIPDATRDVSVAYLPPMSGLASNEVRLDPGAIAVRIGEGRTAEVLRNLCYQVSETDDDRWDTVIDRMRSLFHVEIHPPMYIPERGEITMEYQEPHSGDLDISAAGRGLQQTLLLLVFMAANPGSVILLDEPDAHLEILRQREIYNVLSEMSLTFNSQIIAASHSEVILEEAARRDLVVAFVGKPHRIGGRHSQLVKALKDIGFNQYYQAEETGWVLYLEGSTDLSILQGFARKLGHEQANDILKRPFVRYVSNRPGVVEHHFHGLREACPELMAFALFDRLKGGLPHGAGLGCHMWKRREIENYLCMPETLLSWARASSEPGPLVESAWERIMRDTIVEVEGALRTLNRPSPWDPGTKVSDDFLDPLFEKFFEKLGLPDMMLKRDYHLLVPYVPDDKIDPEVRRVLDEICAVADQAAELRARREASGEGS
ncbi:MAG: ATP-dependent nuclease [Candidatus Xenobia bacterium]